jgi:hypothetical protein
VAITSGDKACKAVAQITVHLQVSNNELRFGVGEPSKWIFSPPKGEMGNAVKRKGGGFAAVDGIYQGLD